MKKIVILLLLVSSQAFAQLSALEQWRIESITVTPPTPGQAYVQNFAPPPSVVVPYAPQWEGPLETGFPGPAYRVPAPDRTLRITDAIGRVWYIPSVGPKPMIEMPKSWIPPTFEESMKRAIAQGYKPPAK